MYQQRLLCDLTAEIHTRHAWAHQLTPAQAGDTQQVPNTAQNPPGISSFPSFCHHERLDGGLSMSYKATPNHPDKPFGVYDAQDRPSFFSLIHTHCATC